MAGKKVIAVNDWPMPRTKTDVLSFVAFCCVYRRFVPSFSRLAGPLNEALRKDTPDPIECTAKILQAFSELKGKMTSPQYLHCPE
jgi:hypothetical protein